MFFEKNPLIINPDKSHRACLFLIDTSGAMNGEIINEISRVLNFFREEVKKNKTLCEILDIAVVEFSSTVQVIQEFAPVEYMEPIHLTAGGTSDLNCGLRIAIDKINERHRVYRRTGAIPYTPYLIVVTDDGISDSPIDDIAEEIRELEEKGKLRLFVMGTKGSTIENLRDLGLGNRIVQLDEHLLTQMLDYSLMSFGGGSYYEVDKDGNKHLKQRKREEQGLPPDVCDVNKGLNDWL